MQKAIIVSDNTSLEELNGLLESGDFYVEHVSASPSGSWMVVLEEGEDIFNFEMDEEEEHA